MQNSISPAEILGRKKRFCSSVPKRMIVGPTVLMVSIGTGAIARIDSSKKMKWSTWLAALAAVLLGPAEAEPAVLGHLLPGRLRLGPDAVLARERLAPLRGQQRTVVGAQLAAELLLLFAQSDEHGALRSGRA